MSKQEETGSLGILKVVMFDEELIALNEEIANHPALMEILSKQEDKDIYVLIAEVSAYLGVILDGTYTKTDILHLCTKMTETLRNMRTGLIVVSGESPNVH